MKEKYIVHFISKIKKVMIKFIESEIQKRHIKDLVPAYGNILTVLYDHNGALSMKEISSLLGKEKSTVTELINKLEKLGYIRKEKSDLDKRVTNILLTNQGLALESNFVEISNNLNAKAFNSFTEDEKSELFRLLKKLYGNFK